MKFLTYQESVSKSFREKLYNNPNTILDIDESVEVVVKENSKNKMHLILNKPSATLNEANLGLINAAGSGIVVPISSTTGTINTIAPIGGIDLAVLGYLG